MKDYQDISTVVTITCPKCNKDSDIEIDIEVIKPDVEIYKIKQAE